MRSKADGYERACLLQKAKQYAFLLLKFRLRSVDEVRQRLLKNDFESGIIEEALAFLKEKKFLDDPVFAGEWIRYRLKKPYGLRRIRQELAQKGVAPSLIESCISAVHNEYSEKEPVSELVKNKYARSKGLEPEKAKRRIYAYCLRRGFSPEVVIEELGKVFKD